MTAALAARLAAHGLTLTAGERTTHGYTARWCLTGLGAPAWFGTLAAVERWAERWLDEADEHALEQTTFWDERHDTPGSPQDGPGAAVTMEAALWSTMSKSPCFTGPR